MKELSSSEKSALINAAKEIKVNPIDLYALILSESGWNPLVKNSLGYGGLIQFGKTAAKGLGYYSVSNLIAIHPTRISQLNGPVIKYFLNWRTQFEKSGKLKKNENLSRADLVSLCFYPAYFRQNDKVLPQNVQSANNGIYSINNYVKKLLEPALKAHPINIQGIVKGTAKGITFLLAFAAGVFYISKKK